MQPSEEQASKEQASKECPSCKVRYAGGVTFCPTDGVRLERAHSTSLAGETLEGRYLLEEKIGSGGLGQVYRARHLRMDKAFAVKLLLSSAMSREDLQQRFDREARALSRLTHPFCVAVTDYGFAPPHGPYIVMELVEGAPLSDFTRGEGLPLQRAIELVIMVLKALAHAHEQGIAHRDLKPDNIMLVNSPVDPSVQHPKILDFGLAKIRAGFDARDEQSSDITQAGLIIGTPHYMAPERIADAKGADDALGDLYSVGILLYELCCGQRPFVDDDVMGVLTMQLQEEPRPPRLIRPALPAPLEALILRSIRKDPGQRFASADELATALEAILPLPPEEATALPPSRNLRPTGMVTKLERPHEVRGDAETQAASLSSMPSSPTPQRQQVSLTPAVTRPARRKGTRRGTLVLGLALGSLVLVGGLTIALVLLLGADQKETVKALERTLRPRARAIHQVPPSPGPATSKKPAAPSAPLAPALRRATQRWERSGQRARRRISRTFARYLPRHPQDVAAHLHIGRLYLYALWVDDGLKVLEKVCERHPELRLDDATLVALTFAYRTTARRRARKLIDAHAGKRAATVLLVGANAVGNRRHRGHLIRDAKAYGAEKYATTRKLLALAEAPSCKARRVALAAIEGAARDPLVRIMLALLERKRCLGKQARKLLGPGKAEGEKG